MQPTFSGIHHLKFCVSDLQRSIAFYRAVFAAERLTQFDHHRPDGGELFAVILDVPGLGTKLELRLDADIACRTAGTDPMTLSVPTRTDLVAWHAHLDTVGARHSPVPAGVVGWLLVIEDPDGLRIRLYTLEMHGPEVTPSWDDPWVRS